MVHYSPIRRWRDKAAKARAIDTLIRMRGKIFRDITNKRDAGSFLLASWNLRDFDSDKFKHGKRLDETYLYIAEIMSAFDLIAVQEVNRDLSGIKKLVQTLGPNWDWMASDTTEGRSGNQERLAFIFNTDIIQFRNIAGEVVLPGVEDRQFARTPYVASFQAGWFKFNLCTTHIYFGSNSGSGLERRVKEIGDLAGFMRTRPERETGDYILLGDFNIRSKTDKTMKALTDEGFTVPPDLVDANTNLKGNKPYDQLALRVKNKMLEIGQADVFDFERACFRTQDFDAYAPHMKKTALNKYIEEAETRARKKADKKGETFTPFDEAQKLALKKKYYGSIWRTFQMSDHKPIWVELKVDFTIDYLNSLRPTKEPLANL